METSSETAAPAAANGPEARIDKLLAEMHAMHAAGELQALVIGFVKKGGAAAVQSTPMSGVMMNHLSKLWERRVAREYDRALAQANGSRATTGAGAVPESARQPPGAALPRKVRRQVAAAQRKQHEQNQRKLDKLAAADRLVRKPATTTN